MSICSYSIFMMMEKVFSALGERNRLRMALILQNGPLNVSEIASVLGLSQSNASHHLKLLLDSGVLARSGRGNWVFYHIRRDSPLVEGILRTAFSSRETLPGFSEDMNRLARCLSERKRTSREFFDSKGETELREIGDALPDTSGCLPFLEKHMGTTDLAVEVGSGAGGMIPFLLSRAGRVLAVDSSRKMLDLALRNTSSHKLESRVELRLGEAEHLPVENDAAGTVLAHMVLHHCGDPRQAISEAARVLRPGGVLLVVDLLEHADPGFRTLHGDLWPGFSAGEVRGFFRNAKLSVTEIKEYEGENILAVAGVKGEKNELQDQGY